MYQYGQGVEHNDNRAIEFYTNELYTKSANQENEFAQLQLGVIYQKGLGIK